MKAMRKNKRMFKGAVAFCVLGVMLIQCSCGIFTPPCEHSFSGEYTAYEFEHAMVCELCGECVESERHKFTELIVDSFATENHDGKGHYECYVCHYRKEADVHNYAFVEEQPSTCYQNAISEHYECTACHKVFKKYGETYVETTLDDITHSALSHDFDPENVEITKAPTIDSPGTARLCCQSFERCHGYVDVGGSIDIFLPRLSETESYNVNYGENNVAYYTVTVEYVMELLKNRISYDGYRERIAEAVSKAKISADRCEVEGHMFAPAGFDYENYTITYHCEHDESHTVEIKLPQLNDTDYTRSTTTYGATCTVGERIKYTMNKSWKEVLTPYEEELVSEGYVLKDYVDTAEALIEFYIPVEGSEPNPNSHPLSMLETTGFTAPYYDVHTNEYRDGEAFFHCKACGEDFSEEVKYSKGKWRHEGNSLYPKYYRDYTMHYRRFTAPVRTEFKYRIDLNGGTAPEDVKLTGAIDNGFFIINDDLFTRAGYKLTDIELNVDRNSGTVGEGRVEFHKGLLRNYWTVKMGPEYMGDVIVTLKWTYV